MADRNTTRAGIPAKLRFEVFKRDKFICTYCGTTAAQKLLHCDHIKPVAEGGKTTLLNLTTACVDCNLGKGARLLSDDSAMGVQHRQLADMEERRQQLELMRLWREELETHAVSEVDIVADSIIACTKWGPSDSGRNTLRRLIKKHGLVGVLTGVEDAFHMWFRDGSEEDWEAAFGKIALAMSMREQAKTDPHLPKLIYIQGILRRRLRNRDNYVEALREPLNDGIPIESLEALAKRATSWEDYRQAINRLLSKVAAPPPKSTAAPADEDDEMEPEEKEHLAAWNDPLWHLQAFAFCLSPTAAALVHQLAEWCGTGGYADNEKVTWPDVKIMRGLHAVGLITPSRSTNREVWQEDDRGNLLPCFRIRPLTPREAANTFNRFGSLKIGFWHRPHAFARVDQVH